MKSFIPTGQEETGLFRLEQISLVRFREQAPPRSQSRNHSFQLGRRKQGRHGEISEETLGTLARRSNWYHVLECTIVKRTTIVKHTEPRLLPSWRSAQRFHPSYSASFWTRTKHWIEIQVSEGLLLLYKVHSARRSEEILQRTAEGVCTSSVPRHPPLIAA